MNKLCAGRGRHESKRQTQNQQKRTAETKGARRKQRKKNHYFCSKKSTKYDTNTTQHVSRQPSHHNSTSPQPWTSPVDQSGTLPKSLKSSPPGWVTRSTVMRLGRSQDQSDCPPRNEWGLSIGRKLKFTDLIGWANVDRIGSDPVLRFRGPATSTSTVTSTYEEPIFKFKKHFTTVNFTLFTVSLPMLFWKVLYVYVMKSTIRRLTLFF